MTHQQSQPLSGPRRTFTRVFFWAIVPAGTVLILTSIIGYLISGVMM